LPKSKLAGRVWARPASVWFVQHRGPGPGVRRPGRALVPGQKSPGVPRELLIRVAA
jgi:hypothetical protein